MENNSTNSTTFSADLPETSYEEGGYHRVREVKGILADVARAKFGVQDGTPVLLTEYHMFGAMFEPETADECDMIITCGEHRQAFFDVSPENNLTRLARWAVLPA